ncbi:hypothetical protein J6590_030738 [Homalodisca vitripennis]|nr:hypothetical protein J6590_030738 [Homalodisca vitripennis]
MAVVGPSRHSRLSVSMSVMPGAGAGGHQAILAAAQPYYHPQHGHQPAAAPAHTQDVQPDRPIGYGAFGVVWSIVLTLPPTATASSGQGNGLPLHAVRFHSPVRVRAVSIRYFATVRWPPSDGENPGLLESLPFGNSL